jgi:hypothetical protein
VVKAAGFSQLMLGLTGVAALGVVFVLFLPNEAALNAAKGKVSH